MSFGNVGGDWCVVVCGFWCVEVCGDVWWVVGKPITLSLPTRVEVELGL